MDAQQAKRLIEGVLFVSDQPVALKRLRDAVGLEQPQVRELIDELNQAYQHAQQAFRIQAPRNPGQLPIALK